MKKNLVNALITGALISTMAATPVFATPSVDDIKEDKTKVEGEVSDLQTQLTTTLGKIDKLESDIDAKQKEVEEANIALEESLYQQDEQYDAMKVRIKYMYEEGGTNFLEILLESESFSDFINKAEYVTKVHTYDRKKLNEYIETTKEVEDLKSSLEEEVSTIQEDQASLETEKESLNNTISSKETEIAKLDSKLQQAIADQQEQQRREEEQRAQEQQTQPQPQPEAQQPAEDNSTSNNGGGSTNNGGSSNSGGGSSNNGGGSSNSGGGSSSGGSSGGSSIVPPQGQDGAAVVAYARQFIGYPYVYGGNSLTNGTDCSGFTKLIFAQFGVTLGRTDTAQASAGVEIPLSQARAGDLVVYYGHVGIYNGSGGLVHASSPSVGIVEFGNCQYRPIRTVRRVL